MKSSIFLFIFVPVLAFSQMLPLNVSPIYDGPNCFNYALYLKGILPTIRRSAQDEMTFYMDSICRKVDKGNPLTQGLVGAIRGINPNGKTEEIHGFYLMDKDTAFTKNGPNKNEKFQISSIEDIYQKYKNQKGYYSHTFVEFYDCNPNLIETKLKKAKSEVQALLNSFKEFEFHLQNYLMENSGSLENFTMNFEGLQNSVERQVSSFNCLNRSNDEVFSILVAYYKYESLVEQFQEFELTDEISKFYSRAQHRIKRSLLKNFCFGDTSRQN